MRALLLAALLANVSPPPGGQEPVPLEPVLRAAADYVARYEQELTTLVAEEDYTQRLGTSASSPSRRLRSDLLLVFDESFGFVGFRDVFEVDGRPVRDREARLARLFLSSRPADPLQRARRIAEEGARYNLNPAGTQIRRTVNMPFTALEFLRRVNQPRSSFRVDEKAAPATGDVAVTFIEQAEPRLIDSPDRWPARGVFWIDPRSGRVSRTELSLRTGSTRISIHVSYAEDPDLRIWLPATMEEQYVIAMTGTIQGEATYTNFRQFRVETATDSTGVGKEPDR